MDEEDKSVVRNVSEVTFHGVHSGAGEMPAIRRPVGWEQRKWQMTKTLLRLKRWEGLELGFSNPCTFLKTTSISYLNSFTFLKTRGIYWGFTIMLEGWTRWPQRSFQSPWFHSVLNGERREKLNGSLDPWWQQKQCVFRPMLASFLFFFSPVYMHIHLQYLTWRIPELCPWEGMVFSDMLIPVFRDYLSFLMIYFIIPFLRSSFFRVRLPL